MNRISKLNNKPPHVVHSLTCKSLRYQKDSHIRSRNGWRRTTFDTGFTLLELLVVISIIGILSSVILASLNSAREKAFYARAQAELDQFIKAAIIAQGESAKRLQDITGSACSDCICRGRDIRNIPESDSCYINWVDALTAIQNATRGTVSGLDAMTRDPWGSPYGLDENEKEGGPNDCRMDTIRSAGPDGILYNGDDQGYVIPHRTSCP